MLVRTYEYLLSVIHEKIQIESKKLKNATEEEKKIILARIAIMQETLTHQLK